MATQFIADSQGVLRGKFTVPAGLPAGNKLITAIGAGGSFGSATFSGQGTLERQTWQQQTTISETRWQSPPPPTFFGWNPVLASDPLAQTFTMPINTQLAAVDLWFTQASTTTTRVQIRATSVGLPTQEVIAEAVIQPWQIAVPPVTTGSQTTFSLVGVGNLVVPSGTLSISVEGRGTGGVAAVPAVAPTYGAWVYSGVSPTNSIVGSITLPFSTGALPGSFSLTENWVDGSAAITFTKVAATETTNYVEYKGTHPASGNSITIQAGRQTITSGTTGIAAQPGRDVTFSINGNTYTFAGSASGVAAAPAVTTQNISLPGTGPLTLEYDIADAGLLSVTYNTVSGAPGSTTRVTFPSPVLLLAGVEYALVVLCDDADGTLAVAELGKFDVNAQRWITSQPYTVGVLLSSANARTWTPHQDRDMAFRLLAASYTASSRIIDLGVAAVANTTDLLLMSYAERPASSTNVAYRLTLPDSTVVTVSDGQSVKLPSAITGNVKVEAILSGTPDMAPVLFPGTQLVSGTISESANYVTRAVPAGAGVTVKVIYEAVVPSGAGVTVTYRGIDSGDTWAAVTLDSTRNVDDGFVEFVHEIAGITETAVQIQLVLTGTTAARPRVRDLRVIVL